MPIYAYRCSSCAHERDVLQKISEDPLTVCPACSAPTFTKQVTAAGFQLKGGGWYVTDFRDGGKKADKKTEAKPDAGDAKPAAGTTDAKPAPTPGGQSDGKSSAPSPEA